MKLRSIRGNNHNQHETGRNASIRHLPVPQKTNECINGRYLSTEAALLALWWKRRYCESSLIILILIIKLKHLIDRYVNSIYSRVCEVMIVFHCKPNPNEMHFFCQPNDEVFAISAKPQTKQSSNIWHIVRERHNRFLPIDKQGLSWVPNQRLFCSYILETRVMPQFVTNVCIAW